MKATTIRELKHHTSDVLRRVEQGETVELQRRGKPVAVLSPPQPRNPPKRPDYAGRLKAIYGDLILATTATEMLAEERGDR